MKQIINSNSKKALLILFLGIFIIAAMIFVSNKNVKKLINGINENPSIGEATVVGIEKGYKKITYVKYVFKTNNGQEVFGKSYSLSDYDDYSELAKNETIGHVFKVIYNVDKPNEFNKILISDGDFKSFKLP